MSEAMTGRDNGDTLAKAALAVGVLAAVGFFVLGLAVGGWWFAIGVTLGAVAVVLGLMVRQRPDTTPSNRRLAVIGLVLGAIVVAWFVIYLVVDTIV